MSRKRFTPEQIIHKLRQAEVELANGQGVPPPIEGKNSQSIQPFLSYPALPDGESFCDFSLEK